jgi:hypothetical protein
VKFGVSHERKKMAWGFLGHYAEENNSILGSWSSRRLGYIAYG